MKYIYGASVQGIQSFIFQTNKLKEIAGASQLVDNICSSEFKRFCLSQGHPLVADNILMSAAGTIKYLVSKDVMKKIVLSFPKHIANYAPGITISQAVVELSGNLKEDIAQLERRLSTQRNRVSMPIDQGFMGLERARRTGGVAYTDDPDDRFIDRATLAKKREQQEDKLSLFKLFKEDVNVEQVPFDLSHINKQHENAWIAIIHADGNGLGNHIQRLSESVPKEQHEKAFKTFSTQLEMATKAAAKSAFEAIVGDQWQQKIEEKKEQYYPFRPVVLGGDDLTVITRADLAFEFTTAYLRAFEEQTKKHFRFLKDEYRISNFKDGITACAGIAYIKNTYPFHYGVDLAEQLTKEAKGFSKSDIVSKRSLAGIVPSSISFYKVQASYTSELIEMRRRTLYAEVSEVDFNYGPYLLRADSTFACVDQLQRSLAVLETYAKKDFKGVSKLRQWVTELYSDPSKARFMMDRMASVNSGLYEDLELENEASKSTNFLYELLQLHSFKN